MFPNIGEFDQAKESILETFMAYYDCVKRLHSGNVFKTLVFVEPRNSALFRRGLENNESNRGRE